VLLSDCATRRFHFLSDAFSHPVAKWKGRDRAVGNCDSASIRKSCVVHYSTWYTERLSHSSVHAKVARLS
jgi:hypothetical protein